MNWRDPQSYSLAVVAAVVLHLAVIGLLFVPWPESEREIIEPAPQHLLAKVVQEENKAVKQRREQAEKQRKREQARKRAAKKRAEQKKAAKKAAEKKARQRKEQQRKEKQRREKRAKEKAAKEKALKAARDKAAREKAAQAKAAQEQALAEQLAQEQAQRELEQAQREAEQRQAQERAQAAAARAAETTSEYLALIRDHIAAQWRYPPRVDASMEVTLRLSLVPTGEVVQLQLVKGSGHEALDRSVEQAVYRAQPLPVPDDIAVFEQNFRTFTMNFRPENATW